MQFFGAIKMLCMDKKTKRGPGRPKSRKETTAFQVRIDRHLSDALEQLASKNRRPRNTEVVVAIEQYLEAAGLWPPSQV